MLYKKCFIFIILLILNIYLANAEINFARDFYRHGETVQTELSFNYKPLNDFTINDISLYNKENVKVRIGLFLIKLDDYHYYAYFNLPAIRSGNYTFNLDNYVYIKDNILQETSEQAILQVKEAEDPLISIDPTIVKLDIKEKNYFNINIKNKGVNTANINIKASNGFISDEIFTLDAGEEKNIEIFGITSNKNENLEINYDNLSYIVPVWITTGIAAEEEVIEEIIPNNSIKFIESNNIINLTLSNGDSVEGGLRFKNFYNKPLYNLNFKLTNNLGEIIRLNLTSISIIEPNEIKKQYLWINEGKSLQKSYSGSLMVSNEFITASFPIYVNYQEAIINKNITLLENTTQNVTIGQKPIEEPKKRSKIWIILLIIFVAIIVILTFLFYKKKPRQESFEEFISALKGR